MCAVIDACVFSLVFDEHQDGHARFSGLAKWIRSGKGKLIVGGKKYFSEIGGKKVTRLLIEFEKGRRLVRLCDNEVDREAARVKRVEPAKAFNDEHIVAMVSISKCCVVCTDDTEAIQYLKRADLYRKGVSPPKIFKHKRHTQDLCIKDHIVQICRDEER